MSDAGEMMKKRRCMDFGDRFLSAMLVGMVGFALGMSANHQPEPVDPASVESVKVSVEEARFMLECTQDWGLSGDECQAVLRGENPPAFDGSYCGC